MLERREDIMVVAKKVARLLAENQVTYSDVRRVFNAAEDLLKSCTVRISDFDSNPPSNEAL